MLPWPDGLATLEVGRWCPQGVPLTVCCSFMPLGTTTPTPPVPLCTEELKGSKATPHPHCTHTHTNTTLIPRHECQCVHQHVQPAGRGDGQDPVGQPRSVSVGTIRGQQLLVLCPAVASGRCTTWASTACPHTLGVQSTCALRGLQRGVRQQHHPPPSPLSSPPHHFPISPPPQPPPPPPPLPPPPHHSCPHSTPPLAATTLSATPRTCSS